MILVAGLGITGQSVIRYLRHNQQSCIGFDTREDFAVDELQEQFPSVSFYTGVLNRTVTQQITKIILSPGISLSEHWLTRFKQKNIPIIGDIELFAQVATQPIISITGSNGKSTVTSLVSALLTEAGYRVGMGGNIGIPALDLLVDVIDYDVYVLELSSFQLETTCSLHSISATVLNISEDHMDRYDSLQDYIHAKQRIFNHAKTIVLPASEKKLTPLSNVQFFGDTQQITLKGQQIMEADEMALKGKHHVLNAQAAVALTAPFNLSIDNYQSVFKRFKGLAHRTQLVLEKNGVRWINDSKGTNVGATMTAIESFGLPTKNIILIAGGVGKGADFSLLSESINQYCQQVILFGRDAQKMAQAIEKSIPHHSLVVLSELSQAVEHANKSANKAIKQVDTVLFSPACASFDQFKNYIHRGEVFETLVQKIKDPDYV